VCLVWESESDSDNDTVCLLCPNYRCPPAFAPSATSRDRDIELGPASHTSIPPFHTIHTNPSYHIQFGSGGPYSNVMAPTTLLDAQTSALFTLLNLNETPSGTTSTSANSNGRAASPTGPALAFEQVQGPLVWKVLVLDEQSKDILATSLRVQDLREQGVTLHMCVVLVGWWTELAQLTVQT
jgi:hypothetical protein